MNRDKVIVDGTRRGPGAPCNSRPARQDLGPKAPDGTPPGRNGILVWKADHVSVENLTVCNFLNGSGYAGNEIWWDGGYGLSASYGRIGLHHFHGSYLTATTTFYGGAATAAAYGIYASRASDGRWDHAYSSNFNDSDFYVGACLQICNVTIDDVHAQYGALGYSGTDAGGMLVVENSEFDHNVDGFDTNSDNSPADGPSPQDGACPNGATSPVTHTHSCWVFTHNYVHDNNNPNVPESPTGSGNAPVGTGISFDGGRDDTIIDNRIENNGAWGIILTPFPDTESPPPTDSCRGASTPGRRAMPACMTTGATRSPAIRSPTTAGSETTPTATSRKSPRRPPPPTATTATPTAAEPSPLRPPGFSRASRGATARAPRRIPIRCSQTRSSATRSYFPRPAPRGRTTRGGRR